jgi:membrane protein YqaA with SNARE-associated domain
MGTDRHLSRAATFDNPYAMVSVSNGWMMSFLVAKGFRHWIFHLGALGFIPLGLLDNSVVPVPGSMDVLTIVLSARDRNLWPYYALMATIGSVVGGLVTYRLARKGGQEALAKRVKPETVKKVQQLFERWGLGAIAIPAMLPPPVPMVPFVMAAGAAQYPVKKFVFALSLGRAIRYMLLALLAARYGRNILSFFDRFGNASHIAIALMLVFCVAGILFVILWRRRQTAVATHTH